MSRALRLGHIDLSFHGASAAVVQAILERDGHTVELSAAPHEQMFERNGRGEVDLLVSAWLPASHGTYLAPHRQATHMLGVLYRPYYLWGCRTTCRRAHYRKSRICSGPRYWRAWNGASRGSTRAPGSAGFPKPWCRPMGWPRPAIISARAQRPFRVHIDPVDDGVEIVNGVADRVRAEIRRRIGLEDILHPTQQAAVPAA